MLSGARGLKEKVALACALDSRAAQMESSSHTGRKVKTWFCKGEG